MQGEICQVSVSSADFPVFFALPFICPPPPLAIQSRGPSHLAKTKTFHVWSGSPHTFLRTLDTQWSSPHHQSLPGSCILPTALKCAQTALPNQPTNKACRSFLVLCTLGYVSPLFLLPIITTHTSSLAIYTSLIFHARLNWFLSWLFNGITSAQVSNDLPLTNTSESFLELPRTANTIDDSLLEIFSVLSFQESCPSLCLIAGFCFLHISPGSVSCCLFSTFALYLVHPLLA